MLPPAAPTSSWPSGPTMSTLCGSSYWLEPSSHHPVSPTTQRCYRYSTHTRTPCNHPWLTSLTYLPTAVHSTPPSHRCTCEDHRQTASTLPHRPAPRLSKTHRQIFLQQRWPRRSHAETFPTASTALRASSSTLSTELASRAQGKDIGTSSTQDQDTTSAAQCRMDLSCQMA